MHMKIFTTLLLPAMTALAAAAGQSLTEVPLKTLEGKNATLKDYGGKVLLIVNVASECGFTPQYAGLQALHEKYAKDGFAVLGFPCNDFGGQEPGSAEEIKTFCTSRYNVTFPMFEKLVILGDNKHPLYAALTGPTSPFPGDVQWNFTKFLIGKDGKILGRFESDVEPDSAAVEAAISKAIGK
jgi:glutathione peroxidase